MNVLLLTIEKFRGEQKILSNNKNINLFSISEKWLNIFYKIFYGKHKINEALKKAYSKNPPKWYVKRQKNYQDFLERIFSELNQKYNFDFVVSADFRYYSNVDWGRAAEKKNDG